MPRSLSLVADLARVLLLLRDAPDAREEQKAAFRRFVAQLGDEGVTIRANLAGLTVAGSPVPPGAPGAEALREQLLAHRIGELHLAPDCGAAALLAALRALAAPAGDYAAVEDLIARVEAVAAGQVRLVAVRAPTEAGVPDPEPETRSDLGGDLLNEEAVGMLQFVLARPAAEEAGRPADALLEELARNPAGEGVPDLLKRLVEHGEEAARAGRWERLFRVATAVARAEASVPAGTHGRAYGIALRRLLPRTSLERIAAMVVAGPDRAGALDILRRFGDEGTEVLLRLLVAAPTLKERRGYYDALVELRQGEALLVHMLGHSEWYVVRNVAELCGEMGIASAVPELVRQLRHPDDRVRRAVVAALSRIGGAEALEALQRAIADPSPAVRLFAIRSVEGRDARALARPLAAQLEREPDPDMVREILLALGRIGSPDAIQTLIKASQPARRLFGRKPVGIRLAAVEGLRLAGGSVAIGTLQALLADEEREVSEAAQRALAALPRT